MKRRTFLGALSVCLLGAQGAAAQDDYLRATFNAFDLPMRQTIQEQLALGGFYAGRIDASYGPGTQQALTEAADFLAWNSGGRLSFDLGDAADVRGYMMGLVSGELNAYLYGEGEEMDG